MTLGQYLRLIREKKGLSLRDVSNNMNISYGHLSEIENGNRIPKPTSLGELASFYRVRFSKLNKLKDSKQ